MPSINSFFVKKSLKCSIFTIFHPIKRFSLINPGASFFKYSPSIKVLISKINAVFLIETMIAKSNNKLETHNMKWSKYKSD